MLFRLLLLLLSFPLGATVFQLHSVNQQITDADGIIMGHYLRSRSVQLENEKLATQMIFKMNKEIGMQSEIFGMDEIIVHYPGGKIGDITEKVEGVPKFIPGEKVVIMIKSTQDRFWGMNLGLGTFKVINYGNQKMIVNTLFPNDRRVGQMELEEFEHNVKLIKRSSFRVVHAPTTQTEIDKYAPRRLPAALEEKGKNRTIASISEPEENDKGQSGFTTLWLGLLFAAMGGIFRLLRQKEAK